MSQHEFDLVRNRGEPQIEMPEMTRTAEEKGEPCPPVD